MTFGILKETKKGENRVICTPAEVRSIAAHGHRVFAQSGCGQAAGFSDESYAEAGAMILQTPREIFDSCEMIAKVKELEESELSLLRGEHIILACLHPALHPEEVDSLIKSGCIAFTAEDAHRYGSPNCEAAGKLGAFFGLESMLTVNGGKGLYVGGLSGAPGMRVLILGCGLVGRSALSVLYSLGAHCTAMDISPRALRAVSERYGGRVNTAFCSKEAIAALLPHTDMVLNCVKWQKERRDFLIDREMLLLMEPESVLVDISNDAPGAIESSRETTFDNPRYTVNGVIHYCVANLPSAVARTASIAYAAEMLPQILSILDNGADLAAEKDEYLRRALTVYKGRLVHEETARLRGNKQA